MFVCKLCGRAYNSRSNLQYHLEGTHMNLALPCVHGCGYTARARETLGKHTRKCDGTPQGVEQGGSAKKKKPSA